VYSSRRVWLTTSHGSAVPLLLGSAEASSRGELALLEAMIESGDGSHQSDAFDLEEWRVTPSLNRISCERGERSMQPLSMEVLCYLAAHSGEVVTHQGLLHALWPGRATGEEAIHRRIADLRQLLGDDARHPRFIETIPKRGYRLIAEVRSVEAEAHALGRYGAVGVGLALIGLVALLALFWNQSRHEARIEAALATAADFLARDEYERAYATLRPLLQRPFADGKENVAPDTRLELLLSDLMVPIEIDSAPSGAEVLFRPYGEPGQDWQPLGVTPIESTLPRGTWLVRFVADGREPVQLALPNPSEAFNNVEGAPFVVSLPEAGTVPEGMVFVPPIEAPIPLLGFVGREDLGGYLIGRCEVRNSEYAEFVADGGYHDPAYWSALQDGDEMTFEQVATRFVDASGHPGPAGWSDGRPPPGTEALPVTGISWYEAMAYARYRGMTLPSARHWARAALGLLERKWPLARAAVPAAHLEGTTPIPVDAGEAYATWGALNMIGNVREWTRGYSGAQKLSLGSSFAGPRWNYALPAMEPPMRRAADQGFRLASYDESFEIFPLITLNAEVPELPEVSDEEFTGLSLPLRYRTHQVTAQDVRLVAEEQEGAWSRRTVLIPTHDDEDPLPVLLFVPQASKGPYQPIVFLPPGDSYVANFPSSGIDIAAYRVDFIIREGRVLVWPILWGTHERFRGGDFEHPFRSFQEAIVARRDEVGRLIDYLEDSPEFDGEHVGMLAMSYGGTFVAPFLLATEPRLKVAVLLATGLAPWNPGRAPVHVNPNTFWPRVRLPVMTANGVYDVTRSLHALHALQDTLGTDAADKRTVLYEAAHWPLPAHRMQADTLEWLDTYLGSVSAGARPVRAVHAPQISRSSAHASSNDGEPLN
jgi:DNA-binding winged helix-turn-helix (wHTH) protein/formylglycine-generating enzyme required for sulfatase activity/dienelactone hydrolase